MMTLLRQLLASAALASTALGAHASPVFTSLYSFSGTNDGAQPLAGLVQGLDGYFYGTAQFSGPKGHGTVFKISTNGTLMTLHSFTGGADGAYPYAALLPGRNGCFHGTTWGGGANHAGTVFKINASGTLTTVYPSPAAKTAPNPAPRWCRAATAASMAQLGAGAPPGTAPCSRSTPRGC